MDLVQLELPEYDKELHACLTNVNCADPKPTAYPENPVFTAVTTRFTQEAPQLTEFLSKVSVPLPVMNKVMAHMDENELEPDEVALLFLKNYQENWTEWLPDAKAQCVMASL